MSNIPVKEHGELEYVINDCRTSSEFKSETFSGYKRTDVKKVMLQSICNNKLEESCYWCAELICSGNFMEIWEIFIYYLGKHIYNANPKLAIYLNKRFQIFRNIMIQSSLIDDIELRNNHTIRMLFAEIVVVLISTPKKSGFELLKINKKEEFDMTKMTDRLKATSCDFALPILHKKDPKEIMIAINEFTYHITGYNNNSPNMLQACYWLEWIIEFDIICKNKNHKCACDKRFDTPVESKYQCDIIWVIWDSLFYVVSNNHNEFVLQVLESLKQLFCIKFTSACTKKRRYLLYFAISMLCEPYRTDQSIISEKGLLQNTLNNIPCIYKQLKNNEIRPKTDYLFSGIEDQTTLEKCKNKMEWMNSVDIFNH
jgi:hypothetical protein